MGAVHGAPITIAASKITDHRSPQQNNNRKLRNITKTIKMRYKVNKCYWKNSTNPLWCKVATGLQYVKKKSINENKERKKAVYTNAVKVCLSVWYFAGVWHTASQEVRFSPTNLRQELERHCLEIPKERIYSFFSNSFSFILWNALSSIFDTQAHDASVQFSSVQSLSCVQLFVTPWTAACQASLSITNS